MLNLPKKLDICCSQMTNLLNNAGLQGLSVIVVPEEETFGFRLQFRSINADVESSVFLIISRAILALPEAERKRTTAVRASGQCALQFCPGCGYRLSKSRKKQAKILSSLADEHHVYNME